MKFVIALILIFSFTLLFAAEFEITSKIKENPAHHGLQMLDDEYKYDNNGDLCALLIVRCGVKDINFSNTASKVAQIDKQGEYYITMKKGARYIVLKKDGFGSYKEQFGLVMKSGSVYEMSADEKFKQVSQIPIMVTTDPSGAEIFIDNVSKGRTSDGKLSCTTKEGKQTIKVEFDGFETIEETANIKIGNQSFDYELVEAMDATISIKSNPSGADVWIKEIKLGKTPVNTFFPAGTYTIKLEKENYETINEQITITDPTDKTFSLTDIRANLTVKTNKNATITFNGKEYIGGIDKLVLLPQTINFRIEQNLCESITQTYTLKKGEKKVFELYPENIGATLTVKTHKNATVYINNDSGHKGGVTNMKLSPQMVNISVEMPKAETIKKSVLLDKKVNVIKEYYPEVQTGIVMVNVIPADAEVLLTGDGGERYNSKGKATFRDVPVGSYELTVNADDYKTHTETFRVNSDKTTRKQVMLEEGSDVPDSFVFVHGGTFQMGSNDGDSDEKPIHSVTVSDFYIGKYEVTQKEWKEIMGSNPSNWKGNNLPVEKVSWYDAVEFCNKKSKAEGLTPCYTGSGKNTKCNFSANGYRLPTEAEWEYAAGGGSGSRTKWAGTNSESSLSNYAWFSSNSGSKTHSVGGKKANELGIYDMSGNVWEWCNDWYDENYYSKSPKNNPQGASSGERSVLRGGSWHYYVNRCRVADRYRNLRVYSDSDYGFRFVRSP